MYLSPAFLSNYKNKKPPFGGNGLGYFIYLRTYSRWKDDVKRREYWWETCQRVVEYNISLYQGPATDEDLKREAEELFDHIFHMRVFPAGRVLWVGGTEAVKKYGSAVFNCAFNVVDRYESFCDTFHLLLVGAGVGFRVLYSDVEKLPELNKSIIVAHKPYNGKPKAERAEYTMKFEEDGSVYIVVGDSKEGWVDALRHFLSAYQRPDVESIIINYDSVRPRGEPLQTFGGRASGHQALRDMFKYITQVIKSGSGKLRPIDCLDIMNIIGYYVVCGGVRRTSEICLFSPDDKDILYAKNGLWEEGSPNYGKFWRSMSNNSIFFSEKPDLNTLMEISRLIRGNGEPGFLNAAAASKRRPWFAGINPCAEIILADKGVCNLCEVNMMAFLNPDGSFDFSEISKAFSIAVRYNMRQTNITMDLPEWDAIQKRDRLMGVSHMGMEDFIAATEMEESSVAILLAKINQLVQVETDNYAKEMRIPRPLLATTIKPGGTLPLLPTVSSGAHKSFSNYYIRRVRINSSDPLARAMMDLRYPVYPEASVTMRPEVFDTLSDYEKTGVLQKTNTWVIELPVATSAQTDSDDEPAVAQFHRYLRYQYYYTDHNTSITIYVGEDEWQDLMEEVIKHWDDYIAISFLPKNTTAYPLMPLDKITEEEYNNRKEAILHNRDLFDLLTKYELESMATELIDGSCESGICPVR